VNPSPLSDLNENLGNIEVNVSMENEISVNMNLRKNVNENEILAIEKLQKTNDISASAARMISTLRESYSFTGAALQRVATAADNFVSDISNFVQDEINDFCKSKCINVKDPDVEMFLNKFKFDDLFKNMQSLKSQIKVLKNKYTYIEPLEIPLGCRIDQRFEASNNQWQQKQVYETMQYVPIIETLKLIMSHDDIRQYITSEKSSNDDWLISFRDGNTFKTHEFFQKYPSALRIQLYYDDVIVNNPLGSKVHPHKLGAFYFVIQNIPQHFNSFLGAIHVLALCHTADIDKYGMEAVLAPFLRDLKLLESQLRDLS